LIVLDTGLRWYDGIAGWAGFGKALATLSLGVRQHSGFHFFFIVCLSFKTAKSSSMDVSVSLH
jgi:hypothetical protein